MAARRRSCSMSSISTCVFMAASVFWVGRAHHGYLELRLSWILAAKLRFGAHHVALIIRHQEIAVGHACGGRVLPDQHVHPVAALPELANVHASEAFGLA